MDARIVTLAPNTALLVEFNQRWPRYRVFATDDVVGITVGTDADEPDDPAFGDNNTPGVMQGVAYPGQPATIAADYGAHFGSGDRPSTNGRVKLISATAQDVVITALGRNE